MPENIWLHGRHRDEGLIEEISGMMEDKLQPYRGDCGEEVLSWLQEHGGLHIYTGEGVALAVEPPRGHNGPVPERIRVDFATIEANGWWKDADGSLNYSGSGDEA